MGETTKAQQEQCSHSCRVSAVGRVEGRRRAEGRGRWIQPSARLSSVCGVRAPQAQWRAAALLALATRAPVEIPAHFHSCLVTVVYKGLEVGEFVGINHGETILVVLAEAMVGVGA